MHSLWLIRENVEGDARTWNSYATWFWRFRPALNAIRMNRAERQIIIPPRLRQCRWHSGKRELSSEIRARAQAKWLRHIIFSTVGGIPAVLNVLAPKLHYSRPWTIADRHPDNGRWYMRCRRCWVSATFQLFIISNGKKTRAQKKTDKFLCEPIIFICLPWPEVINLCCAGGFIETCINLVSCSIAVGKSVKMATSNGWEHCWKHLMIAVSELSSMDLSYDLRSKINRSQWDHKCDACNFGALGTWHVRHS